MRSLVLSCFLITALPGCLGETSKFDGSSSESAEAVGEPSRDAGGDSAAADAADDGGVSPGDDGGGEPLGCGSVDPPTQLSFPSPDALEAKLLGRWQLCVAAPDTLPRPFGSSDIAGVEFTDDDHMFILAIDPSSGELVRSAEDPAWEYSFLDTSSMNGPGVYQIDLAAGDGAGGSDAFAWVSALDNHLGLAATMTAELEYVRIP
jgi:hypothetical protein